MVIDKNILLIKIISYQINFKMLILIILSVLFIPIELFFFDTFLSVIPIIFALIAMVIFRITKSFLIGYLIYKELDIKIKGFVFFIFNNIIFCSSIIIFFIFIFYQNIFFIFIFVYSIFAGFFINNFLGRCISQRENELNLESLNSYFFIELFKVKNLDNRVNRILKTPYP